MFNIMSIMATATSSAEATPAQADVQCCECRTHSGSATWMASGIRRPSSRLAIRSQRSEEHTSELQSLMRISYAVFCLKKKNQNRINKKHKEILVRDQNKTK